MSTSTEKEPPAVGGALRTVAILDYVAGSRHAVSATDIARATALNPSTAFNITRTLAAAGYLHSDPGSRRYTTGPALRALSHKVSQQAQPHELARLPMQGFANRFEVVVSLWRRISRYSISMLLAAENQSATRIQVAAGVRLPLLHGSMGRLMALGGGLSDVERKDVFAVVNFERPLSYRSFMQQAKLAAEVGWSIDDGHIRAAVTSVSVPVYTDAPTLEHVCTATMFRGQYKGEALELLASELRQVAQRVAVACTNNGLSCTGE